MLNAKSPHFFEGFNPATNSEILKIPSKFIKHMEGKTSGSVSLVGPSGSTWHVDLIQRSDGLFFHDGWAAFVRDHFIECGDSLVFRYDGNLHFTVQVFDQSSCEKEAAFWAVCSQDPSDSDKHMGNKRERENTISCLDDIFEGVPKKMRGSQVHSECITVAEPCQAAVFSDETENCSSLSKNTVTLALPLQSRVLSENAEATIQNRISKDNALGSYVKGCMPMLSAPEAERVARSFTSSFPNFTKIMKRFNVSGSYTLNIPYQFSMGHLPKCKIKIVLRNLKGESWTVNSVPTTKVQTSHTFCGGWLAFVRDNDIEMGDICIFELVSKFEMRVQILWVGKEGVDCPSGKADFTGLTNGYGAALNKISEHLPKKMRGNSRKAHLQHITDKKGSDCGSGSKSSAYSRSKACNGKQGKVIQNKTSLDDRQGSHTKGCVSMKSAPEEKRAAQSFISSFPHFVRIMKKFNISGSYTLKIPYQFSMTNLPNCRTEIVLRNLRGESWTVNSVPTTKVQTLHTFCGGWMAFVRGNDIQMGDICIFELIGKCEMRVHISGVGKKGLDYQAGKAASNELALGSSISNCTLSRNA
uniref:TF-B3 domain-containing protein n=1 Tax=Davidia involucrata TaxID=16924 RepID=A0A5B7AQQ3_DAVIN